MWICEKCKEENEDSFDDCWKCTEETEVIKTIEKKEETDIDTQETSE